MIKKIINNVLLGLSSIFLGYVLIIMWNAPKIVNGQINNYVVEFCSALAIAFVFFVYTIFSKKQIKFMTLSDAKFILVLISAVTFPRLLWIFNTDIPPISDFNLYHTTATEFLTGDISQKGYVEIFPHVIGYPYVLSFVYRIFGAKVIAGQLFNVLCSCVTSVLMYGIAKSFLKINYARVCALICGLWVSQIFYVTLISTEALYTTLTTLSVFLFTKTLKNNNKYIVILLFISCGIFASFANAIRPLALIFVIAVILYTVLFNFKYERSTKLIGLISMVIMFSTVNHVISASIEKVIGMPPAKNSFGYTFLVGSNSSSNGGWNKEDADYLFSLYNSKKYTMKEIDSMLVKRALERIQQNIPGAANHYINKNQNIWASDSYGVYWNKLSVETTKGQDSWKSRDILYFFLSEMFYAFILILSLAGCIISLYKREQCSIIFIILMLLGYISAYMLTEVQARYHYPALSLLAICAAYGIQQITHLYKNSLVKQNITGRIETEVSHNISKISVSLEE